MEANYGRNRSSKNITASGEICKFVVFCLNTFLNTHTVSVAENRCPPGLRYNLGRR